MMVSTRSVKHKFSEGEKVLCYEPDPAKTKVLYNSKVLDTKLQKDVNGRKVVHFLIHFQGWNSTWDRFVTEDFILKDTDENRRLQKELAEKAQLTSGGNLYRRGRKRRTLSRAGSDDKRGGAADSDSGGEGGGTTQTPFSPGLKAFLDSDYALINNCNKLVKLPASPNAVEILEAYMKEFTISQLRLMCHKRGNLRPSAGKNAQMTVYDIITRANLCREISDGLRVYLDFMTEVYLLYPQERFPYKEYVTKIHKSLKEEKKHIKTEIKEEPDSKPSSSVGETDRKRSLRSHTESIVVPASSNNSLCQVSSTTTSKAEIFSHRTENTSANKIDSNTHIKTENNASSSKHEKHSFHNKKENGISSIDLASLLGHNVVKGGENLLLRPMSKRERDQLKKLVNRKLVPDWFLKEKGSAGDPTAACLFVGAIHLARALVKIPEIFPNAEHSESKINLITEYLGGFTKFLEQHPEWFAADQYCENFNPLSPDSSAIKMEVI